MRARLRRPTIVLPRTPGELLRLRPGRPSTSDAMHNARIMRGDSVAMGIINAATPFLPVLIARLGGSAFQIGLLTAIPAVAGFVLAIPIGQVLQRRGRVVFWYSAARMLAHTSYAVMALALVLVPRDYIVPAILVVWAVASLPSTIGMVLFPIVMDGAAGPHGRMELMSRRWSYMGITTAITVLVIGQFLDRLPFSLNYEVVFVGFTLAGFVSFYYSRRFRIPTVEPPPRVANASIGDRVRAAIALIRSQPAFVHYSIRQLVYVAGTRLVLPLFPLYYVHEVGAPDAWIGIIATGQSLALLAGYQFWRRQSRVRGTRILLLVALLVSSLYPAALSLTNELVVVAALATLASFFAAGVDLILFDELMRTVPREYGVTFVSIDTTLVNMATIVAPLAGATLAGIVGIDVALRLGAFISLCGVVLFIQAARRQGDRPDDPDRRPRTAPPPGRRRARQRRRQRPRCRPRQRPTPCQRPRPRRRPTPRRPRGHRPLRQRPRIRRSPRCTWPDPRSWSARRAGPARRPHAGRPCRRRRTARGPATA